MKGCEKRFYEKRIKRPMDFFCALLVLILFSPVILVVSILVRLKLGSPIIFRQKRPGLHSNIFVLYKFRTMTNERDSNGNLLPDHVRLTKFGKILRSTSLDELPELFNILKGNMSFVGPRPLLIEYLPYYTERENTRHNVRPGLTGLAQISGRNYLKWNERLEKDAEYSESISFLQDIRILVKTVKYVVKQKDIAVDTEEVETVLSEERKIINTGK